MIVNHQMRRDVTAMSSSSTARACKAKPAGPESQAVICVVRLTFRSRRWKPGKTRGQKAAFDLGEIKSKRLHCPSRIGNRSSGSSSTRNTASKSTCTRSLPRFADPGHLRGFCLRRAHHARDRKKNAQGAVRALSHGEAARSAHIVADEEAMAEYKWKGGDWHRFAWRHAHLWFTPHSAFL